MAVEDSKRFFCFRCGPVSRRFECACTWSIRSWIRRPCHSETCSVALQLRRFVAEIRQVRASIEGPRPSYAGVMLAREPARPEPKGETQKATESNVVRSV